MTRKFFGVFFFMLQSWACFQLYAQPNEEQYLKGLIQKNSQLTGLSYQDIADAVITRSYKDISGIRFVYLNQFYNGIEVWNTIVSLAFRNDSLVSSAGYFVPDIAQKTGNYQAAVSPAQALEIVKQRLGLSKDLVRVNSPVASNGANRYIFPNNEAGANPVEVKLVWLPLHDGKQLVLAWNVSIEQKSTADWWNIRIHAQTGAYINSNNWALSERQSATNAIADYTLNTGNLTCAQYTATTEPSTRRQKQITATHALPPVIYPNAPPPFANVSATYRVVPFPRENLTSGFSVVSNPWTPALAYNANAITSQWHSDSNNSYNMTRGNNVFAFTNPNGKDVADTTTNRPDTSSTVLPSLTFIHTPNFNIQPDSSSENKKAAIDNLFYWTNLMHDIFYQYGFNEGAGNMQQNNFGRGGKSGDWLYAYAQDGAEFNNAKFVTTPDSISPKMRMYLWQTAPAFTISQPVSLAAYNYSALESIISNNNKLKQKDTLTGRVLLYNDDINGWVNYACSPATNSTQLNGKIALIYSPSPGCGYVTKVRNAQNAGAKGVIMYSNSAAPFALEDAITYNIFIPAISVGKATADSIIARLELGDTVMVAMRSGIYKDAALDNGLICHEFGHGISHRLTPGTIPLSNLETADEGWSDYFALMMTTDWRTAQLSDSTIQRTIGSYANSGTGIRRKPCSIKLSDNPYTYDSLATNTEKHAIGEVWCSALWSMTWNIIGRQQHITRNIYAHDSTGGNVIALNLVLKGLQLQSSNPGFLDSRDAILRADTVLYSGVYSCAIWNAFARRGMGKSALQGSANSATDQVPAYNLPDSACRIPLPLQYVSVNAYPKTGGIQVTWKNRAETGIRHYEVEKSGNGTTFRQVAQEAAKFNQGGVAGYEWPDANPYPGNNFYRIKVVELTGNTFYSQVVKVNISRSQPDITIYPNPVTAKNCFIQFSNQPVGNYQTLLINSIGQVMLRQTIEHYGGSSTYMLPFPPALPKGIYQLQIIKGAEKTVRKIVVN